MQKLRIGIAALLCLSLVSVPVMAQTAAPAKQSPAKAAPSKAAPAKAAPAKAAAPMTGPKPITIRFTEHKLKNGLRVILSEDHSAPTYSIDVCYNAGSDRKSTRLNSSHIQKSRMPSSA